MRPSRTESFSVEFAGKKEVALLSSGAGKSADNRLFVLHKNIGKVCLEKLAHDYQIVLGMCDYQIVLGMCDYQIVLKNITTARDRNIFLVFIL